MNSIDTYLLERKAKRKRQREQVVQKNGKQFLRDLKSIREVLVFARNTGQYLETRKIHLMQAAQHTKIHYYITDDIYLRKRNVMVIL